MKKTVILACLIVSSNSLYSAALFMLREDLAKTHGRYMTLIKRICKEPNNINLILRFSLPDAPLVNGRREPNDNVLACYAENAEKVMFHILGACNGSLESDVNEMISHYKEKGLSPTFYSDKITLRAGDLER